MSDCQNERIEILREERDKAIHERDDARAQLCEEIADLVVTEKELRAKMERHVRRGDG